MLLLISNNIYRFQNRRAKDNKKRKFVEMKQKELGIYTMPKRKALPNVYSSSTETSATQPR
jgi:hypothetical protein